MLATVLLASVAWLAAGCSQDHDAPAESTPVSPPTPASVSDEVYAYLAKDAAREEESLKKAHRMLAGFAEGRGHNTVCMRGNWSLWCADTKGEVVRKVETPELNGGRFQVVSATRPYRM